MQSLIRVRFFSAFFAYSQFPKRSIAATSYAPSLEKRKERPVSLDVLAKTQLQCKSDFGDCRQDRQMKMEMGGKWESSSSDFYIRFFLRLQVHHLCSNRTFSFIFYHFLTNGGTCLGACWSNFGVMSLLSLFSHFLEYMDPA